MTIEDTLRASLAARLDALDVPPGDVGRALRDGHTERRRRPWVAGLAVAATVVLVAALGFALRSGGPDRADPAPATWEWVRLPDAPLSPRTGVLAVWTGREALFLGGNTSNICPPNALCTEAATAARDGAAYDPATRRWRTIAPAPVPIEAGVRLAVVGNTVVVVGNDGTWHGYDLDADTWRGLPEPPNAPKYIYGTSVLDGRVHILGRGGEVQVLDVQTQTWSTLPASPHQPAIHRSVVQATPEGIVVFGTDSTVKDDGTVPSYVLAEVYRDGTWHRAPRSDMVGGYGWHWTGERLVAPSFECVDGGEANPYGRCIPEGGIFDPGTLTWADLPDPPDPAQGLLDGVAAQGPRYLARGHVYDDTAGTFTPLPRNDDLELYGAVTVWAGDSLITFGGLDVEKGWKDSSLTSQAWAWTP
jgi:hypothetical protein